MIGKISVEAHSECVLPRVLPERLTDGEHVHYVEELGNNRCTFCGITLCRSLSPNHGSSCHLEYGHLGPCQNDDRMWQDRAWIAGEPTADQAATFQENLKPHNYLDSIQQAVMADGSYLSCDVTKEVARDLIGLNGVVVRHSRGHGVGLQDAGYFLSVENAMHWIQSLFVDEEIRELWLGVLRQQELPLKDVIAAYGGERKNGQIVFCDASRLVVNIVFE